MKKIAILLEKLFDEREVIYPYYRFIEEGYQVDFIGTEANTDYSSKQVILKQALIHLLKYPLKTMTQFLYRADFHQTI